MVPAAGDEAWVCLVVTVQHAVPEGGDEAWACLVVSVQHAVPEVPEGGGRAWPGFEPTRRAEGSRRGRRAGGPPPSGTESSYVRALRNRDRFAAALGHGQQLGEAVLRELREAFLDGPVALVAEDLQEDAAEENQGDGGPHARGSVASVHEEVHVGGEEGDG